MTTRTITREAAEQRIREMWDAVAALPYDNPEDRDAAILDAARAERELRRQVESAEKARAMAVELRETLRAFLELIGDVSDHRLWPNAGPLVARAWDVVRRAGG